MKKNESNKKKELPAILNFVSPNTAVYIIAILLLFLGGSFIVF